MERLFLLLLAMLLAIPVATTAQAGPDSVLTFRQMPATGLLLNRGWQLHAARPGGAHGQRGQPIDPTLSPRRLPQVQKLGEGWLRLRFRVGPGLRRQVLVLRITQYAASDIYFNGQLLRRYGHVSADPARVRPYWPDDEPIELTLSNRAEQELLVHFAAWPHFASFSEFFVSVFFRARLEGLEQVVRSNAQEATYKTADMLLFGAFLLLSTMHLVFYCYNPAERANFYFTLYTLADAVSFCCTGFLDEIRRHDLRLGVDILSYICLQTGGMLVVRALYSLFRVPVGAVYRSLWLANFVSLLLLTFGHQFSWYPTVGFMLLVTVEQLRLTLGALRQTRQAAGIIATGFAVSLVLLLTYGFMARYHSNLLQQEIASIPLGTILTFPIFLGPVLAISLFLARQFAVASRLLQVKLDQVRILSRQTLAQQQEKQQLLAHQNEMLEHQVQQRTAALQKTLHHLQDTQNQLVQSEKMASLGELTAGVAHEIQNPLNFVNNFADVAVELLAELRDEALPALPVPAQRHTQELLGEITQALEKITHHGHRADSIVKGMLEHSRARTGERQPTSLNALAEEYLRLSYHGLRAKNKSFNATLTTCFDDTLAPVDVVPQDMGRVLLNLFNNAFYAVQKRQEQASPGYQPEVTVRTRKVDGGVQIQVRDNGIGIPSAIVGKIFQPFFTTKPAGEGTGLGLSLSYDIVTKTHHGTITVSTQEGCYSEFTVSLPTHEPALATEAAQKQEQQQQQH